MKVIEKVQDQGSLKIVVAEESRPGYYPFSITVYWSWDERRLQRVYLSDHHSGILTLEDGQVSFRSWEKEDSLESQGFLAKHFPLLMANGEITDRLAQRSFLEACRNHLREDPSLEFELQLSLLSALHRVGLILEEPESL